MNQVSETQIVYKSKTKASERPKITRSNDAADIFFMNETMAENIEYKEIFLLMAMNRANKVLSVTKISEGGTCGTVVDIKHIFQSLILQNAQSFILCHNHPSGNMQPSANDIEITKKIKEAGKLFDIFLLDHVILSPDHTEKNPVYYSFADEGLI